MMLVVAVVLTAAAPTLRGFFASRQPADAAAHLLALTRAARSAAVASGSPVRLNIDSDGQSASLTIQRHGVYVPHDGPVRRYTAPPGVTLSLESVAVLGGVNAVTFSPDGRCEAAAIEVRGPAGEVYRVIADSAAEPFHIVRVSGGST